MGNFSDKRRHLTSWQAGTAVPCLSIEEHTTGEDDRPPRPVFFAHDSTAEI